MDNERIARRLVAMARELTAGMTPEEGEVFTRDIVKALQKKKRELGIKSMRQNYKGTGSRKAERQLWTRFTNGAVLDLWLSPEMVMYGGVVGIDASGNRTYPNPRKRPIRGNARRVADMIVDDVQAWFDETAPAKVARELTSGERLFAFGRLAKELNSMVSTYGSTSDAGWFLRLVGDMAEEISNDGGRLKQICSRIIKEFS